MHGPYPPDLSNAWGRLQIALQTAWDDGLKETLTVTLGLLTKLPLVPVFRSNCEDLVLCAAQLSASLAEIALARGVRNFFGEPPLFERYQSILKSMGAFLDEQLTLNRFAAQFMALTTPIGRQMELRVNTMKDDLQSAYQALLLVLNRHLAPGEAPSDLTEDKVKAIGGFADVHIGWWRPIGQTSHPLRVAVKHIRPRDIDLMETSEAAVQERLEKRINREMECWRIARHPRILPFIGFSYYPHPILISPWCENGHMLAYLERNPSADRMALLVQVAEGLNFLHTFQPPIIHCDIKPENILIDGKYEALIGDFGLSKVKKAIPTGWTTDGKTKGTPLYMAPELHEDTVAEPTTSSDVYSFSFLMLEILSGKKPFYPLTMNVGLLLMRGMRPLHDEHPAHLCHDLWWLFECSWQNDPVKRPSMAFILQELQRAASDMRQPVRMPIPTAPISESDEPVSPTSDSHFHPGGTSSAPTIPTLHDRTRGTINPVDGTNRRGNFLERASTQVARSVQAVGFHNQYSAHVRDRALSEGFGRFMKPNLPGHPTQRAVNLPPADSAPDLGPFRHGVQHSDATPNIRKIRCMQHGETSDLWVADFQLGMHGVPLRAAVKIFRRMQPNSEGKLAFEDLIRRWRGWHHPAVLPLWHAETSPSAMMVTPWNRNGSISQYIRSGIDAPIRYRLLVQIADGLAYLHSDKAGRAIHGHLQPGCIFIDDDGNARIAGFGMFLALLDGRHHTSRSVMRDVRYQAPEVLEGIPPSRASDIHALSMICLEILSGCRPYGPLEGVKVAVAVTSGERPRRENHMDTSGRLDTLWSFLEEMWDQRPEMRPSAQEVHQVLIL
ncbi:hypothetical protein FRB96_001777 [Tulasnella sp. 330]|nr:hypothetical protein FRB96_001777 [Tulasnella sp. 330]KAG8870946.1 hypothetical protein FRB97_009225 [Tulasnella sp. 331]